MLLAVVAGILFGVLAPGLAQSLAFLPAVFLRLIKSIIAPVLFGVLVRALGSAKERTAAGSTGWKCLVYFEVVSSLALLTGWITCLLVQPGVGVHLPSGTSDAKAAVAVHAGDLITQAFPSSIFDAMARGDVLQITVFSLLFGVACAAAGAKATRMIEFARTVAEVAFRYTGYVMKLAPAAVFASLAITVSGNESRAAMAGLLRFLIAAWVAQVIFSVLVQAGSVRLSGIPLRRFAKAVREPFAIAFATTSSAAALPQTLSALRRLGVPDAIAGIVAPLSLSFNLCGSCIHLAMAALFVAQAAGIELSLKQQLLMLLTLKLTSKGVAGIPRANFVVLAGLFPAYGLPAEGLTVLLGLDALIDPVRTGVNVLGHCAAPPVIARWAGIRLPADGPMPTDSASAAES